MPLVIEHPGRYACARDALTVGLLNNMPDSALEATERQFATLLGAASGPYEVRLRFSSIPEVPRGPAARERIQREYWPLERLLADVPDALIVTGMEPKAPALEHEPYWERMMRLLEWVERHAVSSVWSCLAAHVAAQALSGVRRLRLPEKRFGVFAHHELIPHPLLQGLEAPLITPHSRWNDLPVQALKETGFQVLSASPSTGADLFVCQRSALLVAFQGHPEYEAITLLKEYRRDVGRFLQGEQPCWPTAPSGYFSRQACELLEAFRERASAASDPRSRVEFPYQELAAQCQAPWQAAGVAIYRNWLSHVAGLRGRLHLRATAKV